ncbi:hypothetical protein XA68_17102 [Ophiocordyceps unilateralis]|uniref:Uncharacterized protein n=1 Tax=Ophiocordyceps unilateralis TaxID=268505 RepID=A0A2A9PJ61_OPHUN|nr:hypothetical protein XA68_17102 [Ophiocordyceps unilateralis]
MQPNPTQPTPSPSPSLFPLSPLLAISSLFQPISSITHVPILRDGDPYPYTPSPSFILIKALALTTFSGEMKSGHWPLQPTSLGKPPMNPSTLLFISAAQNWPQKPARRVCGFVNGRCVQDRSKSGFATRNSRDSSALGEIVLGLRPGGM